METIVSEFKIIKNETRQNLDKTIHEVDNVVAQTGSANERIRDVESTINEIRNQSQKIAETIGVIVDIADRINLLSLNASIEAARAGDYGRGFAVVADEIGKLAYQTSESIKDIESVLMQSTKTTEKGVEVIRTTAAMLKELIAKMAESSSKIKILQDSTTVEEKYIKNIIDQMEKNVELAKNIGTGTEEQKAAIESSARAIEHMNEVVSQMVDEIQKLAMTSRSILDNATALLEQSKGDSSSE
jgi:methyl-accepting chemotaxis protein